VAAATRETGASGTEVHTGDMVSVITASETNQLKTGKAKIGQVIVWGVGTGWTIDVYDNASANSQQVWQWVTADGKGTFALQLPLRDGLRVVTAGTAGSVTIVWS